ncbi:metalloregulator ArsR/SmtB family transcription factor [Patulibacter sp. NPDC049589]|uniref:ArsR/SmtB family transcription factor n=1 Tax=Patulibacter sp. NPDC049589 TaxID=3154731 RepID=UPI003440B37F
MLEVVMVRLRVIGEPTRVQIMALLDRLGTATVQEITDQLPSVPSTRQNVAKHLRTLYEAGLVVRQRDGNRVQYRLVDWSALWLIDQIAQSVATHLEGRRDALRGAS